MEPTSRDRSDSSHARDLAAVCTLSPEGLNERLEWIRQEILPHARRGERLLSGFAWELDAAPGLAEKLDRLVALERACCDGIVFEHGPSAETGRLRLEVRGVDPNAPVFRSLRVPQAGHEKPRGRFAKATGFGFLTSLAICCALPLAASALAGGTAAILLASLDDPRVIAVGTILLGGLAWWWLGRRGRKDREVARASGACGPSCGAGTS